MYKKARNFKVKMIDFPKFIISDPQKAKLLKNNRRFKDLHRGERCFILGNGPSLNSVDFTLLENETIFTANQINRHPKFAQLKPKYHFWADPNFFKIDENKPEDMELLNVMKSINTNGNVPECFFPIKQYEFTKKYQLDSELKVNYYYTGLNIYDNYKEQVDYTKPVPGFSSVIMWCITMAIYMGFKEIYLLGCDHTSFVAVIQAVMESSVDEYAYTVTESERKRMNNLLKDNSMRIRARDYAYTFEQFEQLVQYCKSKNIILANCTERTAIDSIPRRDLKQVVANEERVAY